MRPYLKKDLQAITPYRAVHRLGGIGLDANESNYPLLDQLTEHLMAWIQTAPINRYPDSDTHALSNMIAQCHDVAIQQVICGVGSDQLIDCLLRSVLEAGDLVMAPDPTFSMYALTTQINGGTYRGIPLNDHFTYDFDRLYQEVVDQKPKVLFICTPNNPTGCTLPLEEIEAIVQKSEGIVVVDEAYIEFGGQTACALVKKYNNLLVLRTFSKAYGLAGARVGYGIGSEGLINAMLSVKPPYHLNLFSQEIATWVMTHRANFSPYIKQTKEERQRIYEKLCELGYQVYPSEANFIWMKGAKGLAEKLEQVDVFIKQFEWQQEKYYRISVGRQEENDILLKTCEEVCYAMC